VVDGFQVRLHQGLEAKRIPAEPVASQPVNETAFLRLTKIVASIAIRRDTGQGTAQRRVRKEPTLQMRLTVDQLEPGPQQLE